LSAVIVLLAVTTFAAAQEKLDLEQLRIPHEVFVLDNGLTLIVHEDHSSPIVAVNATYHVGSRDERRGRTGFAHLFEHFFFNGSEHHPGGFREAMDDIGANNRNGSTSTDRTNFIEDVPVSALERTLYLEADRMGFLAANITQEMLEREQGVVLNEKRQAENQPYGLQVFTRIVESVYPYTHPYSWSTMGSSEDLQAASLEDVNDWYSTFYGPNNCVLTLAGDITPEQALELVKRYFGAIPPGPPLPKYEKWIPRFDRPVRDVMQDRVPQARIYRVFHAPGWGAEEMLHLQLISSVLSGSKSARLDRRLVYEKELVTDVTVFAMDSELSGAVIVIATVKPGIEPTQVEQEIDQVFAELLAEGPTEDELQRAKTRYLAGFIRRMERLGGFSGRAAILAESMTNGGDSEVYLEQIRVISETTLEQAHASARKWLDAHHYTLTVVPYPELKAEEESIDRTILPGIGEAPDVSFPEFQRSRLANGLEVILLERHGAPMVNMSLAVDAGYAADPAKRPGTASLTLDLIDEGTATRDAFELIDALDGLGAQVSASSSLDLSFVDLQALAMNLSASLELFSDIVLNPAFPEDKVALSKRRQLARISQEKAQPFALALRIVPKLLYGEGHAYATPLTGSGTEASVSQLERDDLVEWHSTWFHPNNATLIVTGDITLAELMPEVEKAFGAWERGQAPVKSIANASDAGVGRVFLIDRPDAEQSVIFTGHVSEPGGQPQDLEMEIVMRLFGGMSTSRLNRNLRLDKHWTYGARGLLADARGQRPLVVIAPVQTDKTDAAMAEIRSEVEGITGKRPIQGEEFASIMRNMMLRLPGRFETLGSLASAAVDLVSYGYSPDYFYSYSKNLRKITESDLAEAAARYIDPERLTWVIVGDLAKIEESVRALGYGEIAHLDADGNPIGGTE
jgi:zinc protease